MGKINGKHLGNNGYYNIFYVGFRYLMDIITSTKPYLTSSESKVPFEQALIH